MPLIGLNLLDLLVSKMPLGPTSVIPDLIFSLNVRNFSSPCGLESR